jgi:hypothetical protein
MPELNFGNNLIERAVVMRRAPLGADKSSSFVRYFDR